MERVWHHEQRDMVEPRSLDNSCDPRLSGSGIGQTESELLHELVRLSGPSVAYPRASFMFRGFFFSPIDLCLRYRQSL